ncbi:MAG: NAD-dependent epimerase/dehydratase family protein [Candidatus Parcubacteria bacterium]|nr:NAD-dependent epimerase/dehydratase family protein [Candidatus Parcubacteria bacterium]
MKSKILITGAFGQIGSELIVTLREKYGKDSVVVFDKKPNPEFEGVAVIGDITDAELLRKTVQTNNIKTIYHLASLLSAVGENNPELAWKVNMDGLRNVLEMAREYGIKVFWPSSIAAFGPTTPKDNTPQQTILEPSTMYGVTKVAGELLCQYYFTKFGVDVRSLRYPGIISWKTLPGGGTTDYAVEIFWKALEDGAYACFLKKNTALPMMYIDDAIRATVEIMDADPKKVAIRTSYNLSAVSFTPEDLAGEIKKAGVPLKMKYAPDFRQKIADSWPRSIDDKRARKDWKWKHEFNLAKMVKAMIQGVREMQSAKQ